MERVALYVRVSTEEQAMHGYSLDTQTETLTRYARENNLQIVDIYRDEGKSARKPYHTRPEFMRLLSDVEAGKLDTILFIKLDRWFRNVREYFKVQEILERNKVNWRAVLEDYETVTAAGQFKVTIMLAVAQNEADRTGERISLVFDNKIRNGTVISGSLPYGYRVGPDKRVEVVPEEAEVVLEAFRHYRATVSQRGTITHLRDNYGINFPTRTFHVLLRNKLYTGVYENKGRENPSFCTPIVPQELFDQVQALLSSNVKKAPSGRVYLFSSILICEECGHRLTSYGGRSGIYYRCPNYLERRLCTHSRQIREDRLERWLFEHLEEELEKSMADWELREAERRKAAPAIDKAAIRRKLTRLKELYVNEIINLDEYRRDYEQYKAQLDQESARKEEKRPNYTLIKSIIDKSYRPTYEALPKEERRAAWHSIIKEIHINNDLEVTNVVFL